MQTPLTVTELSQRIKACVDGNPLLTNVWVKGEITGITYHSSGNIYFTLKDRETLVGAAFFRYVNSKLKFKLTEGQSVLVLGSVAVYDKRGSYQLKVSDVMLEGIGEIQLKLEELRKKLAKEGVFDAARKRSFPFLPVRIGIVTSPTGAALRDILKVAFRRFSNLEIILAPAKVQGVDAPESIVRAIEEINNEKWNADLIIAGRGGGSVEDLLPFSDEKVVRAFASSRLPIISAVGHQIDHPLSDDAADYAAPTPSAAAEFAVPDKAKLLSDVAAFARRIDLSAAKTVSAYERRVAGVSSRKVFTDPKSAFEFKEYELDRAAGTIAAAAREKTSGYERRLDSVSAMPKRVLSHLKEKNLLLMKASESLEKLSPLATLARGYAAVLDADSTLINTVDKTKEGDKVRIILADGSLGCTVVSVTKGDVLGKKEEKTGRN